MAYLDVVGEAPMEEWLQQVPENSIDCCITDPPYGLGQFTAEDVRKTLSQWLASGDGRVSAQGFAGSEWDGSVPSPNMWRHILRVLKPGASCLAFFGPRTVDLGALAMRLAGFDVFDLMIWLTPRRATGTELGRAVEAVQVTGGAGPKEIGHVNAVVRRASIKMIRSDKFMREHALPTGAYMKPIGREPGLPIGRRWDKWWTSLRPNYDPIVIARKPAPDGLVRAAYEEDVGGFDCGAANGELLGANVAASHADGCSADVCVEECPVDPGSYYGKPITRSIHVAAASTAKNELAVLCRDCDEVCNYSDFSAKHEGHKHIRHITQKPLTVMDYLIRVAAQPGSVVLDPFCGSGTTAVAAKALGMHFVTCDPDPEYVRIARWRLDQTPAPADPTGKPLCPSCAERGEITAISRRAIEAALASQGKITCKQCSARFAPGEIGIDG